jgi:hypothetical protein
VAEGCAPAVSEPFQAGDGAPDPFVDLWLDAGTTLRGRLVGPDGNALAKFPVMIRPPSFVRVWSAVAATTDAEGRFTVEHLPARPVVVGAGGPGAKSLRGATVTPGAAEVEVRLTRRERREEPDEDR